MLIRIVAALAVFAVTGSAFGLLLGFWLVRLVRVVAPPASG